MQEEVENRSVTLAISATKLSARVLKSAIAKLLAEWQKSRDAPEKIPHGKQTVKELVGQNQGVSNIEVTDGNIKSFERVAKKYNVDFAVKKDKTVDPPKYVVFFKGRDADVIAMAFKEFVHGNEKKQNRESVRDRLNRYKELWTQTMNRERAREKTKDRGQSL